MSDPAPTSPEIYLQPTERIGQVMRSESQQQRYAPESFSYCVRHLVIKYGLRAVGQSVDRHPCR